MSVGARPCGVEAAKRRPAVLSLTCEKQRNRADPLVGQTCAVAEVKACPPVLCSEGLETDPRLGALLQATSSNGDKNSFNLALGMATYLFEPIGLVKRHSKLRVSSKPHY